MDDSECVLPVSASVNDRQKATRVQFYAFYVLHFVQNLSPREEYVVRNYSKDRDSPTK